MKRLRLSKFDKFAVGVAGILFIGIVGSKLYLAGKILPHYCPYHGGLRPRVWIIGCSPSYRRSISYSDPSNGDPGRMKFGPKGYSRCVTEWQHDWWNFYFYCPISANK